MSTSFAGRRAVPLLVKSVLRELAGPLLLWIAFLFLLLFVMQFLRGTDVLLGSAVTLGDYGRLAVNLAPHFLVMAIPVGLLSAILLGLGRMAEDRELLALGACGSPPEGGAGPHRAGGSAGCLHSRPLLDC